MSQTLPRTIGLRGADIHLKTTDDEKGQAVGSVYSYSDGQFELSLGAYPVQGSSLVFDVSGTEEVLDCSRPLAAIIKGPLDDVRLEIGQVTIADNMAQVQFFGIPPFDARIVF